MQLPARILVPLERFAQHISSKFKFMESFILDIEQKMGIQVIPFDIDILWKSKAPEHAASKSLGEFLAIVRRCSHKIFL